MKDKLKKENATFYNIVSLGMYRTLEQAEKMLPYKDKIEQCVRNNEIDPVASRKAGTVVYGDSVIKTTITIDKHTSQMCSLSEDKSKIIEDGEAVPSYSLKLVILNRTNFSSYELSTVREFVKNLPVYKWE